MSLFQYFGQFHGGDLFPGSEAVKGCAQAVESYKIQNRVGRNKIYALMPFEFFT